MWQIDEFEYNTIHGSIIHSSRDKDSAFKYFNKIKQNSIENGTFIESLNENKFNTKEFRYSFGYSNL